MEFQNTSKNIQKIMDKISLYVKSYAKFHKVAKYIYVEKFIEQGVNVYNGVLLDKSKLFLHTSFFKKFKKEHSMLDRDGKFTPSFFSCRDSWFEDRHLDYMVAEDTMNKIFFHPPKVTIDDLHIINTLYKDLQREYKKS